MSLRYTETNKWKDDWFLSLSNDYRIIWLWLIDDCSISGIWKKSFKTLNYFCNTTIDEPTFKNVFSERCVDKGGFYFIPKYLKVQYPLGISSDKPMIISVRKEIEKFNLIETIKESLGNDYLIIKVKDTGNDKGKKGDSKEEKKFIVPTLEDVKDYFKINGYTPESAIKSFNYYDSASWSDSKGNKVKNWKQKMQGVWFKEENKIKKSSGSYTTPAPFEIR